MKYTILLLAALPLLSACGVKPNDVQGSDTHPRTYPDISHDPVLYHGRAAASHIH
tara:strand:- start:4417 stop:4581 length:165 start_codon:yes stop_codon:yes gene_type:complete